MNLSKALNQNAHMNVVFKHVSAHAGNPYNDEADLLAKEGARQYGLYH